jgi:hypothetical protein
VHQEPDEAADSRWMTFSIVVSPNGGKSVQPRLAWGVYSIMGLVLIQACDR